MLKLEVYEKFTTWQDASFHLICPGCCRAPCHGTSRPPNIQDPVTEMLQGVFPTHPETH